MRNICQRAELLLEAIDVRRFSQRQSLQRHDAILIAIMRFIDHAHATCPQATQQGEAGCADEFLGGLYHEGPQKPERLRVDRCAIVPYMNWTIKFLQLS